MPLRLAIIGLEISQRQWLDALVALRNAGEIEIVGIAHHGLAIARDVAAFFKTGSATPQIKDAESASGNASGPEAVPVFDDLRQLLKDAAPQVIVMDRPTTTTIDFLLACAGQEIGLFSIGPPVESLAEAQALSVALEQRTRLLYVWPRFADAPASAHCAQADEFVRPIRFAAATWLGINYALAKGISPSRLGHVSEDVDMPVRSMSVLAWDALSTLIRLMGVPLSVYAAVRGTSGAGNSFADMSGAASITLRFADEAAASLTLCDRAPAVAGSGQGGLGPWNRRDLMLWGSNGTLKLNPHAYEFRDAAGELIDAGPSITEGSKRAAAGSASRILHDLRKFLEQYSLPPSPHRGWEHKLEEIASTPEALIVSQRTGQPESPDRLRQLRR